MCFSGYGAPLGPTAAPPLLCSTLGLKCMIVSSRHPPMTIEEFSDHYERLCINRCSRKAERFEETEAQKRKAKVGLPSIPFPQ